MYLERFLTKRLRRLIDVFGLVRELVRNILYFLIYSIILDHYLYIILYYYFKYSLYSIFEAFLRLYSQERYDLKQIEYLREIKNVHKYIYIF